ncbi:hypothetical protein FRC18_003689 [Serendipita sp. 400]|nr:hypothetical protein FRC18_003689 [Serendipita sp. 400]
MSILMPPMHSLSQFDPFHSQAYPTAALFEAQEHYFQPAVYSPIGYATMHPFPVDPRWFNTSLSGHASAAPLPFSAITTSDNIIPPHTPTDVLSLSPSSTIAPIPLSGSRDRSRSMSNRIRSLTNSSNNNNTSHATRLSRQSTGSQRIARRATVSSSPSLAAPHLQTPSAVHSPTGLPPPPPYMQSPTLHSPEDGHETRATKRRRTNDHDSSHLHTHTFTVVPEPPLLLTQTQTPHLSQIHAHHAGYAHMQTWAGPSSADPVSHGVGSQHGFAQWPVVPMAYFETHDHHHAMRDDTAPLGSSEPHLLQFQSPTNTIQGPLLYPSPSPDVDTPSVNPSQAFRKMEPESPQLHEHEHEHEHVPVESVEPFEHGPTEFPPRPYAGGVTAISPWTYVKPVGKIYGSRLEQMPAIETRLAKLEDQMDQYLDLRASHALRKSQLPGLDFAAPLMEFGPRAPCRMFGGRIWPTALARRVRRTPRD